MKRQKYGTVYESFAVVEGSGPVPFDMLRYDSCHPVSEGRDSAAMERASRYERVRICLRKLTEKTGAAWCPERWASFGWKFVGEFESSYEAEQVRDQVVNQPDLQRFR